MPAELVNIPDVMESILTTIMTGAETGLQKASVSQASRIRDGFQAEGYRDGEGIDDNGNQNWEPTTDIALLNRQNPPDLEVSIDPFSDRPDILITGDWDTLVDTGELQNSITEGQISRGGGESSIEVGTDIPYATGMDQGTTIQVGGKTHDVPARPFMFMTQADLDRIMADVLEGIPNE